MPLYIYAIYYILYYIYYMLYAIYYIYYIYYILYTIYYILYTIYYIYILYYSILSVECWWSGALNLFQASVQISRSRSRSSLAVKRQTNIQYVYYPPQCALGVPTFTRSAVFWKLLKRGGGDQTHVQKICCKFCMIWKAFWQHKIDIKRLFKGRNVSIWG